MNRQDAFERVIDSLNRAMLDEALWLPTSSLIDEALGSKGNHLVFSNQSSNQDIDVFFVRFCYRGEHHTELEREYFETYYAVDDHLPGLRRLPDGWIAHVPDTFHGVDVAKSVMYNEAMPRYAFQNGLNVRMDGPFESRIIFGVADPIDARDWSSAQLDFVRRLLPHVRQFVRVRLALIESGALATTFGQLLENSRTGVIHLDRRGRIVAANDCAQARLRRHDGLYDQECKLQAVTREDDSRLQDLLAGALPRFGARGEGGSMMLGGSPLRRRTVLHVMPAAHHETDFGSPGVGAVVLIVEPAGRRSIDAERVGVLLGLTPAESAVAVSLARGKTIREIMVATGRSESTIRWHIKHIYAKHGLSRQAELVQLVTLVAGGPGAPP